MQVAADELVETHVTWAKQFAYYRHFSRWRDDVAGLQSAALLGLTLAARSFDPSLASFKTFASRVIDAQIRTDFRQRLRARGYVHASRSDNSLVSVLRPVEFGRTTEKLPATRDVEREYLRQECRELVLRLTPSERDRDAIEMKLEGWRQADIARAFGLSEQSVMRIVDAAIARARSTIGEN